MRMRMCLCVYQHVDEKHLELRQLCVCTAHVGKPRVLCYDVLCDVQPHLVPALDHDDQSHVIHHGLGACASWCVGV